MKRSLGAKTLIYPTPTWIVGSYDKQGRPNGTTAAWGGICCSDPPCLDPAPSTDAPWRTRVDLRADSGYDSRQLDGP